MNAPTLHRLRPTPQLPTLNGTPARRAMFGQRPPLTVRLERNDTVRHLVRRSFTTSRAGYDHSWVG